MVGVTPKPNSPRPSTLAEKVWDAHVVRSSDGEPDLLYVDLHLVHEVTSPQAFDGLRLAGRGVRRPDLTLATEDHNVPTDQVGGVIADPVCGDSHTSTHGAFGALACGIGTSEVEHVLATQTLPLARPRTMAVTVDGDLPPGVTAKDVVLTII